MAAIPLPPNKTIEEHVAVQQEFRDTKLEHVLEDARNGHGHVFFVDAAHFVMGAFLCCVWCLRRLFLRGGSGRKRYSVLGAWNAVTNHLVRITIAGTVSSDTMCELLKQIAAQGLVGPVTLVLDNARYQRCAAVMELAQSLSITLLFLPSYSPNLAPHWTLSSNVCGSSSRNRFFTANTTKHSPISRLPSTGVLIKYEPTTNNHSTP
jgi:transposase